ncbi:MAG TPA: hypothetical protein VMV81_13610 [Phycisphaerae bacterium]|nr:hypothetical protein [Phycisphaerae bacterium]
MLLVGVELIHSLSAQVGFSAKMVFNEAGAVFFSANLQHSDQKAPQISYEDNYAGNAMAAMLAPDRIEIRYHKDFSDARVTQIIRRLVAEPSLSFMREWHVTYQGRTLGV